MVPNNPVISDELKQSKVAYGHVAKGHFVVKECALGIAQEKARTESSQARIWKLSTAALIITGFP